jgi:hypothetical protein
VNVSAEFKYFVICRTVSYWAYVMLAHASQRKAPVSAVVLNRCSHSSVSCISASKSSLIGSCVCQRV